MPRRISLVAETARALRESILAGTWSIHLPGERELCAQLQVSRPTLRAALNELQREGMLEVTSRKRRRILSPPDAPTVEKPQQVIAAISPRPLLAMAPSAVVMVDELRTDLARAGLRLELIVNPASFSARPARALEELTARTPAAAWLIFGSREPMQRWFVKRQLPCLVVGSCSGNVALPSVDIDYRAVCRHAGGLFRSHGHRNPALVLPDSFTGGELDSELGFREAVNDKTEATIQVIPHDGTANHICNLLEKVMRSSSPPTAFLVARGVHVLTVMSYFLRCGLRIPEDISIISRDDEAFLDHLTPAVARYTLEPAQYTRRISRIARQLAESVGQPLRQSRLMPRFVSGETLAVSPRSHVVKKRTIS